MENKPPVANALDIAENVAKIIFESAYGNKIFGEIRDILLFGSTLTGKSYKSSDNKTPHDIDLLVIHDLFLLNELGMFTKYDNKTSRTVPDFDADITQQRNSPESILEEMGSKLGPNNYAFRERIDNGDREHPGLFTQWQGLRKVTGAGTIIQYGGVMNLAELGEVNIPIKEINPSSPEAVKEGYNHISEYFNKAFDEKFASKFTVNKVKQFLEQQGLSIKQTLDIIVMNQGLLKPGDDYQEERNLAMKQSGDPTFWNSIMVSGRLYNQLSGKFDISFNEKYPGSAELFRP
ncbi:MAG: hypothetical protein Q8O89_01500 [Nanoarchaeota archaeon]|nr:hypothetical protein [Nanoarchaeota archaeon]